MLLKRSGRACASGVCALIAVLAAAIWMPAAAGAALPDHRGYELVSPPGKGLADVLQDSSRVRPAHDDTSGLPMAASFASLNGFADVHGTGVATEYLSVRSATPGTRGWSTHATTPVQQQELSFVGDAFGQDPAYDGDFSADLTTAVFRSWSVLAPAPNVRRVENLYLRNDLRQPGAGSYQLLTDAPTELGSDSFFIFDLLGFPYFAGATPDFGHVLFTSRLPRTSDGPMFSPALYEWDHGVERLVGVLPDGTPAPASDAGQGIAQGIVTRHTISTDGRRVNFTVEQNTCGATSSPCGDLYQRIDHATTIHLNASERTDCAGDQTCGGDGIPNPAPDPGGPQPATYWDASANGLRVFFTSTEALTDDAPINGDAKVYMYDASKPDSDPHNLTYISLAQQPASNDAVGVIGSSDDGRYVYFITSGQIVAGGPAVGRGIFLWHDDGSAHGQLAYVGNLDQTADAHENVPGDNTLDPLRSEVTPDGHHVLFSSTSGVGLTGYDHGSCPNNSSSNGQCRELYLWSADDHSLVCASCNPTGAPATSDVSDFTRVGTGATGRELHQDHPMSDDGSRVFFTTGDALVPQDSNGQPDVYEYSTATHSAQLISSGKSTEPSYFMDASANGNDVFFTTREALVGWDVDKGIDLYDARVDGGFPEPPAPPVACSGEACHGQPAGAPASPAASSTLVTGVGNVHSVPKRHAARRHCKRGTVRRRVHGRLRCVKRHRARRHAHRAATQRRSK